MYDYIGANYFGKITDMIEGLILVADHSKFGRNVLVQAFPFNSIRKVVTDEKVSDEYTNLFKNYDIECFIALLVCKIFCATLFQTNQFYSAVL